MSCQYLIPFILQHWPLKDTLLNLIVNLHFYVVVYTLIFRLWMWMSIATHGVWTLNRRRWKLVPGYSYPLPLLETKTQLLLLHSAVSWMIYSQVDVRWFLPLNTKIKSSFERVLSLKLLQDLCLYFDSNHKRFWTKSHLSSV